jgi:hypothetical protein
MIHLSRDAPPVNRGHCAADPRLVRAHRLRLAERVRRERAGLLPRTLPWGDAERDTSRGRARIARKLAAAGIPA